MSFAVVGLNGIGPSTSPLSGVRSNQLSYRPLNLQNSFSLKYGVNLCGLSGLGFIVKEVIQPQVPLWLPCYDFTPVINHTVATALLSVRLAASGAVHSHGVTGGVYKARERIHRSVLICDY